MDNFIHCCDRSAFLYYFLKEWQIMLVILFRCYHTCIFPQLKIKLSCKTKFKKRSKKKQHYVNSYVLILS